MRTIKVLIAAFLVSVMLLSVPAQALTRGSILAAIPDDWYIHFFGGATVAGVMNKHGATEQQSMLLVTVGSIAKEVLFDAVLFGGQIDLVEAGIGVLGAFVFNRF